MDYLYSLLIPFGIFWLVLAIRPYDRMVWAAENLLTVATIIALVSTYPSWPLSDLSYSLIVAFLVLHTIGGHYTYVRVPYDEITDAIVGVRPTKVFGWVRNHYDRVVHSAYGLLVAYPLYELLESYAQPLGSWSYVLSPALIMATSMIFEVLEWWMTELLGGGQGAAYIGAQGDEWDAQKDMGLAALGSVIAMMATGLLSAG
jgi:putative membrane protein